MAVNCSEPLPERLKEGLARCQISGRGSRRWFGRPITCIIHQTSCHPNVVAIMIV